MVALDSLEDGPSEVMRIRDQEAEIYSFIGQLNHSQNEKGMQIMSDFDETIRGKVATTMNLDAESSRMAMARITNLETKIQSDTPGIEMDGVEAEFIECKCCYRKFELENMIQCPTGHRFCFSYIK